eukprot:jgi/Chrzof1/9373/Cz04g00130.t1
MDTVSISCPSATSSVHWLPCAINHNGPARVSEYFQVAQAQCSQPTADQGTYIGVQSAHIRGRRLQGCHRQLPPGFQGLVLTSKSPSAVCDASDSRQWSSTAWFTELTVWNHDVPPTPGDTSIRCLDWLQLADKIHAPIDVAQVEQEMQHVQEAYGNIQY